MDSSPYQVLYAPCPKCSGRMSVGRNASGIYAQHDSPRCAWYAAADWREVFRLCGVDLHADADWREAFRLCGVDPGEGVQGGAVPRETPQVSCESATERDTRAMQALYDAAGAFKDALIDLETLGDAARDVLEALRVSQSQGDKEVWWCRVCAAEWGEGHAEAAPRCPVPRLAKVLEMVKR